jgi:hypothetical protein
METYYFKVTCQPISNGDNGTPSTLLSRSSANIFIDHSFGYSSESDLFHHGFASRNKTSAPHSNPLADSNTEFG